MPLQAETSRAIGKAQRLDIRDLSFRDLEQIVAEAGERTFRARQIAHWLYARGADSFDVML
ncbi:MAG TPA: hypothetical protein VIX12_00445, partial [Candidatus Binataceae bacterium]